MKKRRYRLMDEKNFLYYPCYRFSMNKIALVLGLSLAICCTSVFINTAEAKLVQVELQVNISLDDESVEPAPDAAVYIDESLVGYTNSEGVIKFELAPYVMYTVYSECSKKGMFYAGGKGFYCMNSNPYKYSLLLRRQ